MERRRVGGSSGSGVHEAEGPAARACGGGADGSGGGHVGRKKWASVRGFGEERVMNSNTILE